jgi:hypothetical protein
MDEIRHKGSLEDVFLQTVGSEHAEARKLSWLEE